MTFPRYSAYKDSGVTWLGEVPEHWETWKLSHAFDEIGSGTTPKTEFTQYYEDGDIPWVNTGDLNDSELFDCAKRITKLALKDHSTLKTYPTGSVVIAMYGATIGKLAILRFSATVNQACCVFVGGSIIDKSFLFYCLTGFREQIVSLATGGGQPNISQEILRSLRFACPNLAEQTAIATFLDRETAKIDDLIAEQRSLTALLKEKRQAVISHAVTKGLNPKAAMKPSNNKWLGNVPEHWIVCCLKHIKAEGKNAFVDGPFGSNLKSEHFIDDGDVYVIESNFATQGRIDVTSLKTISDEHFATINRSETQGGDIVIAKIGAQYGKASILPSLDKPAVVSGNSLKLTINQKSCDVRFVNWHLGNLKVLGVMEDIVNATAQPALSLGEMNNLPMLVPPREEQEEIIDFLNEKLEQIDTLITETEKTITLLQERRSALISAAVTGKMDVRGGS